MSGYKYNDGGRAEAGYKGTTGDCVVRAIAIGTQMPYKAVYEAVNDAAKGERIGKRKRGISNARTGVYKETTRKVLAAMGWQWVACMQIGSGCRVHLEASELPSGRIIAKLSRHVVAVVDGVVQDTSDPRRFEVGRKNGIPYSRVTRCVYGYWHKPANS